MEQNKSSSFYFQKAKKNRRSHANLKRNVTFQGNDLASPASKTIIHCIEDHESPNDEIPLPMTQTKKLNRKHRTGSNPDYNIPFNDLDLSPQHNKDIEEE